MECKKCIHYRVCLAYSGADELDCCELVNKEDKCDFYEDEFNTMLVEGCEDFANRTEREHLPCIVGTVVYQTDGERIYQSTIQKIVYDTENVAFDEQALNNSVFLTREEAEKALERMKENEKRNYKH